MTTTNDFRAKITCVKGEHDPSCPFAHISPNFMTPDHGECLVAGGIVAEISHGFGLSDERDRWAVSFRTQEGERVEDLAGELLYSRKGARQYAFQSLRAHYRQET